MLVVDMWRLASRQVSQVAILLLLFSLSWALVNDGARRSEHGDPDLYRGTIAPKGTEAWRLVVGEPRDAMTEVFNKIPQAGQDDDDLSAKEGARPQQINDVELRRRTPTREETARVTTPPPNPLAIRQDQTQIDQLNSRIQSLQQSAQQALDSLSQSSRAVSQASQQLSQSSQQLSQQSQQLSQSSQQLSQNLQQATQSIAALQNSVSSALSASSSAFASCTNSASSVIAQASNDASNKITAAQAQATIARNEADRQVQAAQNTTVTITQTAAAIVGTFIGSSILTVLIVLIVLRYRRKRRNHRDLDRSIHHGGGYYGGEKHPASYNSMAMTGDAPNDIKEKVIPSTSPDDNSNNNNNNNNETNKAISGPESGLAADNVGNQMANSTGNRDNNEVDNRRKTLTQMGGITRQPTGEAIAVNYARSINYKNLKPLKLSDPPPAKTKKSPATANAANANNNNNNTEKENGKDGNPGDIGKWSIFPKVDPNPKRASRLNLFTRQPAPTAPLTSSEQQQQQQQQVVTAVSRPASNLQTPLKLQNWLQRAAVSPFPPPENEKKKNAAAAATTAFTFTSTATVPVPVETNGESGRESGVGRVAGRVGVGIGQLPKRRLSQVKWPLQGSALKRSESMASAKTIGRPSHEEVREGVGGSGGGGGGGDTGTVSVVKNNEAAKTTPHPSMAGIGLPGSVKKLPLRNN